MNFTDLGLWCSVLMNSLLACGQAYRFRKLVLDSSLAESKAKKYYSWISLGIGIFSGFVFFLVVTLFDLSVGHGEVLIAAPMINLLVTFVLVISGRIFIGWTPMKW